MKTWVLSHKKISTLVVLVFILAWFLGYFIPKQNCLGSISLDGDVYAFDPNYSKSKDFKTRNDALDYCMSQRF